MTALAGYSVTALLPLLYLLTPNPVAFYWGWVHGAAPMSPDAERRAEIAGSAVAVLRQLLILGTIWLLLKRSNKTFAALWSMGEARDAIGVALLAAAAWTGATLVMLLVVRVKRRDLVDNVFVRRTVMYIAGAASWSTFVEENWRVFCLIALPWHGIGASLLTSGAFGLSHSDSRAHALSAGAFGVYLAWLFHETGSFWVLLFTHGLVNLGLLLMVRCWRSG